jgi:hypothetical protein
MKKSLYLFILLGFGWICTASAQEFSTREYLTVRQQNSGLSATGLESKYPRTEPFYLKFPDNGIDFKKVQFLDSAILKLELTGDELKLLRQNLFVVTERLSFSNFGVAFHNIYNFDLPVFVTTDAIIHALHMSYDKILKTMERELMAANLESYLKSLYDNFDVLIQKYGSNPALAEGLADADIYVTLAYSLISDKLLKGHVASPEVIKNIWDAIRSEKLVSLPLFTYSDRLRKLDFSQFTVRGHYVYTEQEKWMGLKSLEPYFRTMMWLGRIDFLLTPPPENPWEKPWSNKETQRMNLGAYLLNELTQHSEKKDLFALNEQIINNLVGESDNLLPSEYQDIIVAQGISSAVQLTDTAVVSRLKAALGSDPGLSQKILSDFFFMDPWAQEPGILPVSYRLSGQRFILDSYVLGSLVFDKVLYNGQKVMRMMPQTLDLLFSLGNNDVLPLLKEELTKYPYAGQLANMRYLVDERPAESWSESLYNGWLNSLRDLNSVNRETDLPLFMKTAAWHQEKMNTQLAGWSYLRHDNLLYAKQSYTGGTGCSFPWSYVEPYPAFYGRLKQFATDAGAFFSKLPDSGPEMKSIVQFFPRFAEVMGKLEILAKKELNHQMFTKDETEWLKTMLFHKAGSGIPPYTGWYPDLFFDVWDSSKGDFTVVDVHTQPTDEAGNTVGKVLHTGIGNVNLGVFVAESPFDPSVLMAFTGPLLSYYENTTINFKRMTDQEWSSQVALNKLPLRPEWTRIYLAGAKGELLGKGTELPSQFYTGATRIPVTDPGIIVYPNPVDDILIISLEQEKVSSGSISLFNATGTLLKEIPKEFTAGRNTIPISFRGLPDGVYLVRIALENRKPVTRKIIRSQR